MWSYLFDNRETMIASALFTADSIERFEADASVPNRRLPSMEQTKTVIVCADNSVNRRQKEKKKIT